MEPVTVVFLLISLWPFISSPEPICEFTENVTIRRREIDVEGELTTYHQCKDIIIVREVTP